MFAVMSALHLKDNGDLHVLELASIPNKCMQCCLFLKELTLRCVLCVGFPSALRHAQKNYIRGLCNTLPRCSHLMKILKNENGFFFCEVRLSSCSKASAILDLTPLFSSEAVISSDAILPPHGQSLSMCSKTGRKTCTDAVSPMRKMP